MADEPECSEGQDDSGHDEMTAAQRLDEWLFCPDIREHRKAC